MNDFCTTCGAQPIPISKDVDARNPERWKLIYTNQKECIFCQSKFTSDQNYGMFCVRI